MKKCPFCAEEVQDEAIVCRYCNREINPVGDEQPSENNGKKTKKRILIGCLISLGILGIIGMACLVSSIISRMQKNVEEGLEEELPIQTPTYEPVPTLDIAGIRVSTLAVNEDFGEDRPSDSSYCGKDAKHYIFSDNGNWFAVGNGHGFYIFRDISEGDCRYIDLGFDYDGIEKQSENDVLVFNNQNNIYGLDINSETIVFELNLPLGGGFGNFDSSSDNNFIAYRNRNGFNGIQVANLLDLTDVLQLTIDEMNPLAFSDCHCRNSVFESDYKDKLMDSYLSQPLISPNQKYIAAEIILKFGVPSSPFHCFLTSGIVVWDLESESIVIEKFFDDPSGFYLTRMDFSSDGETLFFYRYDERQELNIDAIDLANGTSRTVFSSGYITIWTAFAPYSEEVHSIFHRRSDSFTGIEITTENLQHQIIREQLIPLSSLDLVYYVVLGASTDGKYVVIKIDQIIYVINTYTGEIITF